MGWPWTLALDLLYPPRCCGCAAPSSEHAFCDKCLAAIPAPVTPLCSTCGIPFITTGGDDHVCAECLQHPPRFRRARAVAIYDAVDRRDHPLKSVLQRYKYGRDVSLAPALASLLSSRLPWSFEDYDVVVPVPLHTSRLRWRGFNQALLLTRHLKPHERSRVDPWVLQRVRATRPQVELDHPQRTANVVGAFRVSKQARLRDKRVLLLDDVFTTGATVNECSHALRRAGAEIVDVLVLARAVLR